MTAHRRRAPLALLAAAGLLLAACSGGSGGAPASSAPEQPMATAAGTAPTAPTAPADPADPALSGELVVFAAASLQDTFAAIGDRLTSDNPSLTVTFNFGSSGTLSTQLAEGAPADVFAAANTSTMDQVSDLVDQPALFTHNSLVIVVPAGNPGGVTGLTDFANDDLKIALCDPSAPCGSAAEKVFTAAGFAAAPDTLAKDVKATLNLVTLGEVDAALVYKTDAIAAGDAVETISFPEANGAINDYPIAVLKSAPNPEAAEAFLALVLSPDGQAILTGAGFDAA